MKALDTIEAYHKQIGLPSVIYSVNEPEQQQQQAKVGDFLVFKSIRWGTKDLSLHKHYQILKIRKLYRGVPSYTILSDSGKKRDSSFASSRFTIIHQ